MGFTYRKSFKAGPIRITASKSGISYSAGVRGARVTKRADGRVQTTVSVPGSGARYTSTTRSKPRAGSHRTAARQSAVPVSAPLPGRRATIMPHRPPVPPTGVLFKGYLSAVTLHPGGIQIERSKIGQMNGNQSSALRWEELVGVDFLDPNIFRNGYVHFATAADPRGLSATGRGNRTAPAARNPHAVMFAWHQKRAYKRLRALLSAASAA